jgi:hypothetical protein
VFEVDPTFSKSSNRGVDKTRRQAQDVVDSGGSVGVYRTPNYNTAKSKAYNIKNGFLAGWRSVGAFHAEVQFDENTGEYVVLATALPNEFIQSN